MDEEPRLRRSLAGSHAQSHEFSLTRGSRALFQSSQIRHSSPINLSPCFLPSTLPLTAFKDEIFISYLFSKLFEGDHGGKSHRCGLPNDWTLELVKTPQKPRHKSWDALAAILFGRAHKSHDVITKAIVLNGQALSELCDKLSNPDNWHDNSMLASITALYIYEVSYIVTIIQKRIDNYRCWGPSQSKVGCCTQTALGRCWSGEVHGSEIPMLG